MVEKGRKPSNKGKSLGEELLKDDFFKPPVDEILEEDLAGEETIESLTADEILEEEPVSASYPRAGSKEFPIKYVIFGGAGVVVIAVVGILLYITVLSKPKIPTSPTVQPQVQVTQIGVPQAPPEATQPEPPAPAPSEPPPPEPSPAVTEKPAPPPPPQPQPSPPPKPSPPPPQPVAVAKAPEPRFSLEVGTYSSQSSFNSAFAQVKSLGLDPYSQTKNVSNAIYYIYLNDSFTPGQAKANSLKLKVIQKIASEEVPQADGSVLVRTGPFSSQGDAASMKSRLDGAGFPSRIDAVKTVSKAYVLKAGKFPTREEAEEARAKLRARGFKAEIVGLR